MTQLYKRRLQRGSTGEGQIKALPVAPIMHFMELQSLVSEYSRLTEMIAQRIPA